MKKSLTVFTLSLITLSSAHAMYLTANCNFNTVSGTCSVFNNTPYIMTCQLHAEGQTSYGFSATQNISSYIYPGQSASVTVNSNNPWVDPLVYVSGYAECF